MEREFIELGIAVLAIADAPAAADEATVRMVVDRMKAAGHRIVTCDVVREDEAAIRDQFERWIADPTIDVVISTGGIESDVAPIALLPLITKTLPGFAELFRYLAYQEIGAAAMLSSADAGQCEATYVFLLPRSIGAVRTALDKMLVPQLDHRTKPRNLVMRLPRIRGDGAAPPSKPITKSMIAAAIPPAPPRAKSITPTKVDSVPVAVAGERTDLGMPMPGKRPAPVFEAAADPPAPPPSPSHEPALPAVPPPHASATSAAAGATPAAIPTRPTPMPAIPNPSARPSVPAVAPVAALLTRPTPAPAPPPPPAATTPPRPPPAPKPLDPEPPEPVAAVESPIEDEPVSGAMVLPPLPPGADPALLLAPASTTGTMSAIGDLPRGKFVYPVRKRSNMKVIVIVGLLVAAGAGFVIATKFFPHDPNATAAAPSSDTPPSPPVTLPETRAPEPKPPEVTPPDAAEIDARPAEIVIDEVEAAAPVAPKAPVAKLTPKVAVKAPVKTPTPAPPTPAHPVAAATPPPIPATPPTPPTSTPAGPVDPDCDEVACVLEHYGRPCCERFKPAAKGTAPTAGGLDRAAVRAGVDRVKAVVIGCGEKNKVKGTVKLAVSVGGDGRVEDVTVKETPDPTLGDCVAGAVRHATFAKTPSGGSFTYPFVF